MNKYESGGPSVAVLEKNMSANKELRFWDETRPRITSREDMKEVIRMKEKFNKEKTRSAINLELCLAEAIGSYDWFGPDAEVFLTNEYDDIINGIDIVVTFNRENSSSLKLGIDATTSQKLGEITKKLDRTANTLKEGNRSGVKYYELEGHEEEGEVSMPRVVTGTNAESTEILYQHTCEVIKDKKEKGPQFAKDDFQRVILKQIENQLVYSIENILKSYKEGYGRQRKKEISKIRLFCQKLEKMSIEEEANSEEFSDILTLIEDNKEKLSEIDPAISENLFSHTEVLKEIKKIDKEKSSQGIQLPEAQNITEKKLMNFRKAS